MKQVFFGSSKNLDISTAVGKDKLISVYFFGARMYVHDLIAIYCKCRIF